MSEHQKPESKPDDLTKTTETGSSGPYPELTDEDLKGVSGGASVPPKKVAMDAQ
jgi:hypothetical protein